MHTRATTGNPQVSATHDNRNDQSDAAVSSGGVNSGCTIGPEVRWVREPVSHFRDLCCTHAPANFLDASRAHTPGQGLHDVARLRTLMRSGGGTCCTKKCLPAPGSTHKCEKNTIQIKCTGTLNVLTLYRRKTCGAVGEAKGLTLAHTAKQLQARYSAGTRSWRVRKRESRSRESE